MADNIKFGIEIDATTGIAQLVKLSDGFTKVGTTAQKTGQQTKKTFAESIVGIERFTNILSNLTAAFSQVFNSFSEAIALSNQYESALLGLSNTAESFGQSQTEANKSALELSKDGLVSVTANATALKFLMQSGFDIKQSMNLAGAAKDMGAFGRTTQDFSQALVDFAKGVKTGSLELTENIGFTQRFSAIMKQANVDISQGIDLRNNLAQREAFYNAVLKEGELNKGNAQKYLESSAGAMQSMSTQLTMLKKDIGDFVKIIVGEMLPSIRELVSWLKDNLSVVIAGIASAITLTLIPAIIAAGLAIKALGVSFVVATGGISLLIGAIAALFAYKFADKMLDDAKATKQAAAEAQAYADKLKLLTTEQKEAEKSRLNFMLELRKSENITITKQWMEQREKVKNAAEKDKAVELEKFQRLSELRNANIQLMNDYSRKLAAIDKNITDTSKREANAKLEADLKLAEDRKALAEKNKNQAEKDAKKKQELEWALFDEQSRIDNDLAEEEAKAQAKRVENYQKYIEDRKNATLQAASDASDAEIEAFISGKTEQQRLEEEYNAFLVEQNKQKNEEKKQADQQYYEDNKTMMDLAKGGYEALSAGISSFVQTGIQGGNALKAAWQSFSSAIISMIAQMIAKAIAFKVITSALNFFSPGAGTAFGALFKGEKGGLPSQFQRKKLAGGGVLWQGASHAQGGIPVEVEGDEITLTKGVYRNPVLRGIASIINVAAGGVSIPNAPRASMLANGGLAALTPASNNNNNNDSNIVFAMVGRLAETVDGLTKQIDKFKATDNRTIFQKYEDGQKEIAAVV